ncbi:MAG: PolC-type DNA polymerase III [Planctomycetaceae bacterium]
MSSNLWIAFDCETTGFLPEARLLEIGAVAFRGDGAIVGEFQRLVQPPCPIPGFITELTGITHALLRDAENAAIVLAEFWSWTPADAILVAHNIGFDLGVLANEQPGQLRPLQRCVDSLSIARQLGEFSDNRLNTIAVALGFPHDGRRHRAIHDAHVVRSLMLHAVSRGLEVRNPELFRGMPAASVLSLVRS